MKSLFLWLALAEAVALFALSPILAQSPSAHALTGQKQNSQLLQQLKSPIWTEQLDAAQKVLKSGNAADIERLEAFASHPFPPLRAVAAQALVKKHQFSPALKTLFYEGADLNWEPTSAGDYALATLALGEVEAEAEAAGYKGTGRGQEYHPYTILDPRIGDLLATRLQKSNVYGVMLFHLAGLPDTLLKSDDEPLSADLKAKVLAAWKTKSARIKNPFTEAQLQIEMAQARKIRYDDFEKGPFYDEVVSIANDGEKTAFEASAETDKVNARIAALPKEAAPTLFRVFKWRGLYNPPKVALQLLADSGASGAFVQMAQIAYGRNEGDSRVEAIRLMAQLDFKRAEPHIEAFFKRPFVAENWNDEAPRLGAALVLATRGEKRAVPAFFSAPYERSLAFLDERSVVAALHAATGLDLPTVQAWRDWWASDGAKMKWQ